MQRRQARAGSRFYNKWKLNLPVIVAPGYYHFWFLHIKVISLTKEYYCRSNPCIVVKVWYMNVSLNSVSFWLITFAVKVSEGKRYILGFCSPVWSCVTILILCKSSFNSKTNWKDLVNQVKALVLWWSDAYDETFLRKNNLVLIAMTVRRHLF